MKHALVPALAAVLAWLAPACSGPDVTLATLPGGDDAAPPPPPPRCASIADCPSGTYCDKASCDSPSGTCELYPDCANDQEDPVCGCDGLTYFDHCLRQASGIASETPGRCPGFTCGGPSRTPCPTGTYCAQLGGMGDMHCSPDAEGNCWVLPAQCPPQGPGGNLWDSCPPGKHCLDTCHALQMGGAYGRAIMCP